MGSLVVVHGTGVRKDSYDATFKVVSTKLGLARKNIEPVYCYWGDVGANLPENPLCLPRDADYRGAGLTATDIHAESWAILYENPLIELETFPQSAASRGKSDMAMLAAQVRTAEPSPQLLESLQALAADGYWKPARDYVVNSAAFLPAVQRTPDDATNFCTVVARAIVAWITRQLLLATRPTPPDDIRDLWVGLTVQALSPTSAAAILGTRGIPEIKQKIGSFFGWGAQWLAAGFAERKRMVETAAIGAVIGDIILYQAARGGEGIRQRVINAIRNAPKPRYVLAHSLGSVAAVDTLVLQPDLEVEHLITIGSPAAVFYELNALCSRTRDEKLPEHFPKWTNIFDPKDLISYIAHRTFHDDPRIDDKPHESGQPLIAAHCAYWASDKAWKHIWEIIPCQSTQ